MKRIWEFYENMNEIVYVIDIDNHELIYMNRKARETYGYPEPQDYQHRKCYTALQGLSSPCAVCTNRYLESGKFYEWTFYNPMLKKTFSLKDTLIEHDGRRYRMEIAIDMNLAAQQKQIIKDFTNNEAMINEGLRLSLSAGTPEKSLRILLDYLGHSLRSDRVYIFEENASGSFDNTYEWCANGVAPQKNTLQNIPYEAVALWFKAFRNNENVIIKDLFSIKDSDALAYEYLLPQDIQSLVVSPLFSDNEIIGFYGVDNPPQDFLNHISTIFQVLGHFIVSILRRRNLVRKLEALSYSDQLTGAKNRHAMEAFSDSADPAKSIGVINCDVLGLKRINDSQGHQAGDQLLIRSFECLREQFSEYPIFRMGGDEFLILCSGIEEEDMKQRADRVRQNMASHKTLLSLGCVWKPVLGDSLPKLLIKADALMYQEKKQYYEKNPDCSR